jgi:uncharacterized protein
MSHRADQLSRLLMLQPHPEGGAFREVFRSARAVRPVDGRSERGALTGIYFLLRAGEASRWHRVASDEAWVWLEGDPLELFEAEAPGVAAERIVLSPVHEAGGPLHVVPAGRWQAARTTGEYTLVSCMVGPGFDFADFELDAAAPLPGER